MHPIVRTGCFTLSLSALLLTGCGTEQQPGAAPQATPVSAYSVTTRDIPETILLPGRVVAGNEVAVSASIPGQVQGISVQVGDRVEAGQLLATLNDTAASNSLAEAKRNVTSLETQLARLQNLGGVTPSGKLDQLQNQIRRRIDNLTDAAKAGALPTQAELIASGHELVNLQNELAKLQIESAVSESLNQLRPPLLQGLQMQVAQARQMVQAAEAQVTAARITSPIQGVVLAQNAAKGSPALPGAPMFSIGTVEQVEFEVFVDPNLVPRLQEGQAVAVQVGTQPIASTKLTIVSPALQPQTKSFTARTPLPNLQGVFKPGMIGQATVTLDPHHNVLAIPKAALLTDETGPFVLQIQNGTASIARLKLGYDNGTWVEVRSGLKNGDQVVYGGIERVQLGSPVKVIATEQPR
ncbi:hypothetical protein CIG75_09200 [Tumebacillus algifaecis]|uniref:Uncharacterized protein n=1 Tax=Tumebacillus algifaecis TaxID=1214604 RepID=A0A223D060_9BACL|nr:efflux RND transporter periplasmic adaptor subunit [Tumebacillus algifaecis]ASS75139.1 hypothetical protein CIG75_09200 [Tumebacillus algifaecis]